MGLLRLAGVAVAIGATAAGVISFTHDTTPASMSLGPSAPIAQSATVVGACDVTGVDVSYDTTYSTERHGYFVDKIDVSEISSPSCDTAMLTVGLKDEDGDSLGSVTGPVIGASTTLDIETDPDAALVYDVDVVLDGGYTPWPTACNGLTFQNIQVGTLSDDELAGVNPRSDLLYGLAGADRLESLQGDDCLDGGDGSDTIVSGNGNSVLFAGAGNDSMTAGNGNNKIFPGSGTNTIVVGSGKNVIDASQGDNTITMGSTGKTKVNGADAEDKCFVVSGGKPPKPAVCA